VLAALALTGCETNQERSAKLEKLAKAHESQRGSHRPHGVSITAQSTRVRVGATTVLHTSEGAAAIVTLRNLSNEPLRDVPLQITVKDVQGASVYTNELPGLAAGLVSASLIPAHGTITWIDDQVQAAGTPASVSVRIGEGTPAPRPLPPIEVNGAHLFEDPSNGLGAEGTVFNRSSVSQQELIVYAVARSGGRIVAAGRAVLPTVAAGASARFQLFFIGDPQGARLEVSAPATTFG
jgi:hypothetical protein